MNNGNNDYKYQLSRVLLQIREPDWFSHFIYLFIFYSLIEQDRDPVALKRKIILDLWIKKNTLNCSFILQSFGLPTKTNRLLALVFYER